MLYIMFSVAEYDPDVYKLISLENLEDRASPELWPEQSKFADSHDSIIAASIT